jgi:hypothetical protein
MGLYDGAAYGESGLVKWVLDGGGTCASREGEGGPSCWVEVGRG